MRSRLVGGHSSAALQAVEDATEPISLGRHRRRVEPAEGDRREQDAVHLAEGAERAAAAQAPAPAPRPDPAWTSWVGNLIVRAIGT